MDRLHKLDIEGTLANLNKLLVTTNERIDGDRHQGALASARDRVLAKLETTLDSIERRSSRTRRRRCWPNCARPTPS